MFTAQEILLNLWRTAPNVDNTSKIDGQYVYWTFAEDTSGAEYEGGTVIKAYVPIDKLAYFEKI